MTLTQLEVFSTVAELKGFTTAAQRLRISQSAVSHAVKSLERELGVVLIERKHSQVLLTDIGQQLLPRVREMLGISETLRQEAANSKGLQLGSLRVGSFGPTSSIGLLPRILLDYQQQYPHIAVQIDEGNDQEVIQWIQERRVDLGFAVLPHPHFVTYPLIEDQIVALFAKQHRLAAQPEVTLADLCLDPFIMTDAGSAQVIGKLFSEAGLTPHIRYRTSQVMSTLDLVSRGVGVALMAELALPKHHTNQNYLVRPLHPIHRRTVGLALHSSRHLSPAASAFVEMAVKLAKAREFS